MTHLYHCGATKKFRESPELIIHSPADALSALARLQPRVEGCGYVQPPPLTHDISSSRLVWTRLIPKRISLLFLLFPHQT